LLDSTVGFGHLHGERQRVEEFYNLAYRITQSLTTDAVNKRRNTTLSFGHLHGERQRVEELSAREKEAEASGECGAVAALDFACKGNHN